jgi:acetoin utilization protein AcuB
MVAAELISSLIIPLKTTDTVQWAAERMADFRVNHLPVVDEEQFLGLIADDDLIEADNNQLIVELSPLYLVNAFALDDQHIYDVLRLFSEMDISVVSVLDQKNNFLGVITRETMLNCMAQMVGALENGSIIILEISNRNNSLAHMAQIVESDNAQILSSYTRTFPDSTRMEVTIKINKKDVSGIVATFLRYDYTVKATFNNIIDDAMDRYDSFMNYLNL